MATPMKRSGFAQGIMEQSSTKKEEIGTLRLTQDGRKFRYGRAGASNLGVGKMGQMAVLASDHVNETPDASAIGDKSIVVTVTAGTAIAENALAGGYLQVNDADGEGHQYLIDANTVLSATGTTITVTLDEAIKVALTTSSEVTLLHNPWYAIVESTTEERMAVGVAPFAITANYYYWAQTGGVAICLVAGTPAIGTMLTMSATAGALEAIDTTLNIDEPVYAILLETGVAGEYKPVWLLID